MKERFDKLMARTGASGDDSELDKTILRVMRFDKDVYGDTLGTSSSNKGPQVKGTLITSTKQL